MNFFSEANSLNYKEANNVNKNRYIFFKDQKAISNFIDIEICLKNNPNFRCLMVIEQNNPVSVLRSKIPESIDKFHKISGLFYPKVTSLTLKRDKEKEITIPLDSSQLIEELVKPGDLIIYELKFKEIWIEVNLKNSCLEQSISFDFEIKVNMEKTIHDLTCILIKMGIKSWFYNKSKVSSWDDTYIFSSFQINKVNENLSKIETIVNFSTFSYNESNTESKTNQLFEEKENLDYVFLTPKSILKDGNTNYQKKQVAFQKKEEYEKDLQNCNITEINIEPNITVKLDDKIKELKRLKVREVFNYDSKINCILNFENLNNLIYNNVKYFKNKSIKASRIKIQNYVKYNCKKQTNIYILKYTLFSKTN